MGVLVLISTQKEEYITMTTVNLCLLWIVFVSSTVEGSLNQQINKIMKTSSNMYTIEHVLSEGESENIPTPTFQNQMMIEEIETCKDIWKKNKCKKQTKNNGCEKENVKKKCKKMCKLCDDEGSCSEKNHECIPKADCSFTQQIEVLIKLSSNA